MKKSFITLRLGLLKGEFRLSEMVRFDKISVLETSAMFNFVSGLIFSRNF